MIHLFEIKGFQIFFLINQQKKRPLLRSFFETNIKYFLRQHFGNQVGSVFEQYG